jgi:hypothetical protein
MTELTREQVLAMPAGEGLDKLVAERVMNYSRRGGGWLRPGMSVVKRNVDPFSTNLTDAWHVAHVMGIHGDWRTFSFAILEMNAANPADVAGNICRAALLMTLPVVTT